MEVYWGEILTLHFDNIKTHDGGRHSVRGGLYKPYTNQENNKRNRQNGIIKNTSSSKDRERRKEKEWLRQKENKEQGHINLHIYSYIKF